MSKSRGLGRGLASLIPAAPAPQGKQDAGGKSSAPLKLPIDRIKPSAWQPRKHFDAEKLNDLAASIKAHGLIQPPVVRKKGDYYELIAGERRVRAMRDVLGKSEIPVIVMEAEDLKMRELALVENLQRDDLNAIEVAIAYQELQKESGLTHEKIAERVGVSRAQVTNTIRLLELPEEVKRMVAEGKLQTGSARAILAASSPLAQLRLAQRTVAEGLSTRRVEELAAEKNNSKAKQRTPPRAIAPHVARLEERLLRHLGSKVQVEDKQGRGRMIIEYFSVEDAQRILDRMGLPQE